MGLLCDDDFWKWWSHAITNHEKERERARAREREREEREREKEREREREEKEEGGPPRHSRQLLRDGGCGLRHCLYTEKKLPSWKKIGLFRPFIPQKLQSWVLLSSVRVPKKVPSAHHKNIRRKTSDLHSPPLPNTKNTCFSNECLAHTMAKVADRS